MARIFISYRRDDSGGWAGRLYDRLSQHFGRKNVFMDIDAIQPGVDFVEAIEQAVSSCDVLVALIGKHWVTITDDSGQRRLDNPEDFVRLEIAAALARNIRVIPALVQGAPMPRTSDLPNPLKMLAQRNASEISDTRFHTDVDRLIRVLDMVLGTTKPTTAETGDVAISHEALSAPQPHEKSSATRLPFEPEMILIPAGEFLMGSNPQKDEAARVNEQPQHRLSLPDYYLGKTPVTNAQYHAFLRATGSEAPEGWDWVYHTPPRGQEDHPVVRVSWYDAVDYCQWLSEMTGRVYGLPSEAEWEKGARGTDTRIFPWGNQWDATRCNSGESSLKKTTSVQAYQQGVSPYGLLDMAGNVWEWTRSLWGEYPYPTEQPEQAWRENLKAAQTRHRVQRGGALTAYHLDMRCDSRRGDYPYNSGMHIGFRVVVLPAS